MQGLSPCAMIEKSLAPVLYFSHDVENGMCISILQRRQLVVGHDIQHIKCINGAGSKLNMPTA